MPIQWNAEADAKLLTAIIQVYDVKISGAKLNEVAEIMGPECTAKALTHRISKIRTLAKADPKDATAQDIPKKKPTKPVKAIVAPKKNSKGGKKAAAERTPSSADGGDEYLTPPESARPKRAGNKRDYAAMNGNDSEVDAEGSEDDGLDKKVKIEVGEDIGEGLRQATSENE